MIPRQADTRSRKAAARRLPRATEIPKRMGLTLIESATCQAYPAGERSHGSGAGSFMAGVDDQCGDHPKLVASCTELVKSSQRMDPNAQIGRASCREKVSQTVKIRGI